MVNKRDTKKKKVNLLYTFFWGLFSAVKFVLKIPFYIARFVINIVDKSKTKAKEKMIEEKRSSIKSVYTKFKLVKNISGGFDSWEEHMMKSDSTIGIVLGARGTGKSALALKIFENLYKQKGVKLYAMGFREEEMPSWIKVVESVDEIKNNSQVLIDEGGILFSSRESMSKPNKLLSELMLIARHKNLSILFISQNSSNLEINVLRQADYLILKPSSLLQKSFERKIIKDLYTETQKDFTEYKDDKGIAYIHSDKFTGFVSNPLPSFWNVSISKSWDKKETGA